MGMLTPGRLLFASGLILLAVVLILGLVMALTAGRRRKKMDQRMREKY